MSEIQKSQKEVKKNLHEGHRDRVRQKFLNIGFENMQDHEILEMMLFYAVPRKDTNDTAHILLNNLGTLMDVFESPIESLQNCGLSWSAAVYIKMITAFCGRYYNDKLKNETVTINEENIQDRLFPKFIGANDHERVVLLLVDTYGRELYSGIISEGSVSASGIYTRKILELSVKYHAAGAILAHNHPSGIPIPSSEDILVTKELKKALQPINVRLLDHVIFSQSDSFSMASVSDFDEIFYQK